MDSTLTELHCSLSLCLRLDPAAWGACVIGTTHGACLGQLILCVVPQGKILTLIIHGSLEDARMAQSQLPPEGTQAKYTLY